MRKYILHRTFVSKDGSVYQQRAKPYLESELPEQLLALGTTFLTLVDDPTLVVVPETKPIEKNVIESRYNPTENPNVVESHFEPKYHQAEAPVEPIREVDLTALNTPDHVVASEVVLGKATASELASLPYVSRKTADRLVQALTDGAVFASYEDLDKWQKLGFGRSWSEVGLILSEVSK